MDSLTILWIVSIFLMCWLLTLTYLYFTSVRHYRNLKISDTGSLEDAINTMFRGMDTLHKMITNLDKRFTSLEVNNKFHMQKFFLKRFNPFGDTGGNQSFSLVLLDANNDGVVLSSLHGRSGTRIYAKHVRAKKHVDFEFSEEEKDVINLATKEH